MCDGVSGQALWNDCRKCTRRILKAGCKRRGVAIGFGSRTGGIERSYGNRRHRILIVNLTCAIMVNMSQFTLKVDNQGRVALPSWWRKNAGVEASNELCVAVTEEGGLVLETYEQGLRRARALVRKYIPDVVLLSDELIAERRLEAERDFQEDE